MNELKNVVVSTIVFAMLVGITAGIHGIHKLI